MDSTLIDKFINDAKEAEFYVKNGNGSVTCELCINNCEIHNGRTGFCGVRYNEDGTLFSLVQSRIAAMHIATSELKPFFHFYPGIFWLSIGTIGCTLKCRGCQNWHLAHVEAYPALLSTESMPPERIAEIADLAHCAGISFTYNEPTVWLEFTLETARAARERNMLSTYISNGMMGEKALDILLGNISAFRFDIKGFSQKAYASCPAPGKWKQVLKNARKVHKSHTHLELVTNIIPGQNDSREEMKQLAEWICSELSEDVPWHITRFTPAYELSDLSATPIASLEEIHDIGQDAGLHYVYIGNVPGHPAESTYCPECKSILIRREGVNINEINLEASRCKTCGKMINVIGAPEI